MTLLPAARVSISPSLVISMPPIWSVVTKLLISPPVAVSHTRTVLSSLQLTNCLLSGVYITCLIPPVWPSNLMMGSLGCSRSNILTQQQLIDLMKTKAGNYLSILSLLPVARAALSLLKLTLLTICLCWRVSSSSPDRASHTLAEKSAAPVAALLASLLMSTPHTAPLCPSNVPIQSPVSPARNIGFPEMEFHHNWNSRYTIRLYHLYMQKWSNIVLQD